MPGASGTGARTGRVAAHGVPGSRADPEGRILDAQSEPLPAASRFCSCRQSLNEATCRPVGRTSRSTALVYSANFVKVAVNVIRKPGEEENQLPKILRSWFGPDAGASGTRHAVALARRGNEWHLTAARSARQPAADVAELFEGGDSAALWPAVLDRDVGPQPGTSTQTTVTSAGAPRACGHGRGQGHRVAGVGEGDVVGQPAGRQRVRLGLGRDDADRGARRRGARRPASASRTCPLRRPPPPSAAPGRTYRSTTLRPAPVRRDVHHHRQLVGRGRPGSGGDRAAEQDGVALAGTCSLSPSQLARSSSICSGVSDSETSVATCGPRPRARAGCPGRPRRRCRSACRRSR